jgi:hypothetical protein
LRDITAPQIVQREPIFGLKHLCFIFERLYSRLATVLNPTPSANKPILARKNWLTCPQSDKGTMHGHEKEEFLIGRVGVLSNLRRQTSGRLNPALKARVFDT